MKSLFEIQSEYARALKELEDHCNNNNTDEVPEDINERLVINENELKEKIEAYFYVITEIQGDIDTISEHIKKMTERKKALENNQQRLKSYVGQAIELYGEENKSGNHFVETALFKATASRSAKIKITDENLIPDQFKKEEVKIKVDARGVKKALESGENIDGAYIDTSDINVVFR